MISPPGVLNRDGSLCAGSVKIYYEFYDAKCTRSNTYIANAIMLYGEDVLSKTSISSTTGKKYLPAILLDVILLCKSNSGLLS